MPTLQELIELYRGFEVGVPPPDEKKNLEILKATIRYLQAFDSLLTLFFNFLPILPDEELKKRQE